MSKDSERKIRIKVNNAAALNEGKSKKKKQIYRSEEEELKRKKTAMNDKYPGRR